MPAIKMPKIKKLNACQRIATTFQETLERLHQQTMMRRTNKENQVPTVSGRITEEDNGATAAASASTVNNDPTSSVHRQELDPQRDNFGLYALKCDRSATKRGLVLNIGYPAKITASVVRRRQSPDIQKLPCEMNHEKYEPVEKRVIVPERLRAPPRRKRKSIAGSQDTLNAIPVVPLDEEPAPTKPPSPLPPPPLLTEAISTNVKEMCRHFERQASVDIFTQTRGEESFEEFDHIFGPSPVPPISSSEDQTCRSTDSKQTVVRRLMAKFSSSSSSDSFGSSNVKEMEIKLEKKTEEEEVEDLQYFKRATKPKRELQPDEKKQSKVDKIVFQDKFIPNSWDPPASAITITGSADHRTTVIQEADFDTAFPSEIITKTPSTFKEVETALVAMTNDGDSTIKAVVAEIPWKSDQPSHNHHHHHDQLTISRHYLNEDVLVWTF